MTKTLYLLRHAQAEPATATQDDHARHLSAHGFAQAEQLGSYLRARHIAPHIILCSTATRTRETFTHVQKQLEAAPAADFTDRLYHANLASALQLIQGTPDTAESLLLIGHNPVIHQLAAKLCADADHPLAEELQLRYAPCTFAGFTFAIPSWGLLEPASGQPAFVLTPETVEKALLTSAA